MSLLCSAKLVPCLFDPTTLEMPLPILPEPVTFRAIILSRCGFPLGVHKPHTMQSHPYTPMHPSVMYRTKGPALL